MRTILLSKSDESYLQKCATELEGSKVAYGIIIGQLAEIDKYIVVHLAKNSEEDVDVDVVDAEKQSTVHGTQRIDDIDSQALSSQWLSACKMLPGSFSVLGIFVSSTEDNVLDERTFKVAKQLLYDVINILIQGKSLCGTAEESAEKDYIFLAHSSKVKQTICKSYTHSANGGSFTSMDCRFVEKPFEWYTVDCNYELDEIFPIIDNTQKKINVEQQFHKTVETVRQSLQASEIFLQNETVDDTLTLDAFVKKKNNNNSSSNSNSNSNNSRLQQLNECVRATIFQPIKSNQGNNNDELRAVKVRQFNGTIRFSGIISSRIYCNPRNSLGDVKRFVRDDVVRSLGARIQVYCDGLTEPNINSDAMFISEPPRRVYFNLAIGAGNGTSSNPIQFSEYIFRGEAPTVVVAQAKQILDIDIDSEHIIDDFEGLPDDETFSDFSSETLTPRASNTTQTKGDNKNLMIILATFVSIIILLISIALHFYLKS